LSLNSLSAYWVQGVNFSTLVGKGQEREEVRGSGRRCKAVAIASARGRKNYLPKIIFLIFVVPNILMLKISMACGTLSPPIVDEFQKAANLP